MPVTDAPTSNTNAHVCFTKHASEQYDVIVVGARTPARQPRCCWPAPGLRVASRRLTTSVELGPVQEEGCSEPGSR